jgi:opacity protein-like surface antigen
MKKITLLSFILTLVSAPAIAEGMYVGVKLGQANYDYSNVTNNDQSAVGFQAGFIINENATVEIEYNNLGGFDSAPVILVVAHLASVE